MLSGGLAQKGGEERLGVLDIFASFEEGAECGGGDRFAERGLVERAQGRQPVESFGDAGELVKVFAAHGLDKGDDLARQRDREPAASGLDDGQLLLQVGIVDPVVKAAPLERVVDLTRAVGGDDDDRRRRRRGWCLTRGR